MNRQATIRSFFMVLLLAACASAQRPADFMRGDHDMENQNKTPNVLSRVGIDQDLGAQLPLSAMFRDEQGHEVPLGTYFHSGKPVLLDIVYYNCTMLCNQSLSGLMGALNGMNFDAGNQFDVVAVSFDPTETPDLAADKKKQMISRYRRPGAEQGMHFLTGPKASIDALTTATGFHYTFDEHTKQFAHSSAVMLITPEGKVAQYYYGIEYAPRDIRLGIIQASKEKIGTPVDALILYCYHYDPSNGRYSAVVLNIVRLAGLAAMLLLGSFVAISLRHERKGRAG